MQKNLFWDKEKKRVKACQLTMVSHQNKNSTTMRYHKKLNPAELKN